MYTLQEAKPGDDEVCTSKQLDDKTKLSILGYCQIIECGVCEGECAYKEVGKGGEKKVV